ncbi:MAG: MFS transporter [Pseudomonadota bacterium]
MKPREPELALIFWIALAHGLSHFFQLVLPPLFPLLTAALDTGYAVLGGALALFYTVSGVAQTAAGFLVDRLGARRLLLAGIALMALAMFLFAALPGVPTLYLAAVLGGLGNSVFHPADLALLSNHVSARRLGHAFAMHGLGGSVGWVLAPLCVVPVAEVFGWRIAVATAGALGSIVLCVLAMRPELKVPVSPRSHSQALEQDVRLLLSLPVLRGFLFFALYAIGMMGFQTFAASASAQLYQVSLLVASGALSAFLIGNTLGIVAGGALAARTQRHGGIVALAMGTGVALALMLAAGAVPLALLLPVTAALGFAIGSVGPSRDILIRALAPHHARGKVYGFVYSGLDVGGFVGPIVYGLVLDRALGAWVFGIAAAFLALAIPMLLGAQPASRQQTESLSDA